jgi:hypothetical protein
MATTSKLIVYNDALRELGSHPLANLTTPNTRLQELDGAFPHAVEYTLSRIDWNFCRRRATLTGVIDAAHPPFTHRYVRPSDYLRKVWIKVAADDEFSAEHAEVGAVFYGFNPTVLIEYMSDGASNYEPVNWPPQFTRSLVVYLAMLCAPKLARAGDDIAALYQKLDVALDGARAQEAVFIANSQIQKGRLPVLRRAIEMLGQQTAGTVVVSSHLDQLRWQMNRNWTHAVRYILEQDSWSFATKRALLTSGRDPDEVMPSGEYASIVEGYSVDGVEPVTALPRLSDFSYGFHLPDDYLHKVWAKTNASAYDEIDHQIIGMMLFAPSEPVLLEYIGQDAELIEPAAWSAVFTEAVAAYLALMIAPELVIENDGKNGRINAPQIRDRLMVNYERKLSDARMRDAVQQQIAMTPPGRFIRARMGGNVFGRRTR